MSPVAEISTASLLQARMQALGLTAEARTADLASADERAVSGPERIAAVTRRMLAVQGQDWRSSRWALGTRTPGTTLNDVHAAYDTGLIVRSWPMRGTVHVVAAEDIGWMQRATNRRVLAGAAKRREFLGIDNATLDRLVETSCAALADGASHDRASLSVLWTEAGIEWQGNWRYHVIWWLCQNGIAVYGPAPAGGEPRIVLADTWITNPRELEGDEALAELAARHATARGPVRARDLAWWAGLTLTEAKRGIATAAESGCLHPLRLADHSGASGELWASSSTLAALDDAGSRSLSNHWRLLPAFDEHLLGYTDRDAQLNPEHFSRIVPGRNGVFQPTVTHAGRVVGTWKSGSTGLDVTPFAHTPVDADALRAEAQRRATFHGVGEPRLSISTKARA